MQQPPPLPAHNPYAAPSAYVDDVVTDQLVLADRGTRLVAKIVDGLIIGGVAVVFAVIAAAVIPSAARGSRFLPTLFIIAVAAVLVALLIVNMVLLHRYGQTMGKRLFSIKILRTDGGHCALLRIIFARWLPVTVLGAIPWIGWIFSLTDPLLIFRSDQRCLHDLIADTIVVKV